ncbi:hypothetical protein [Actinoplanes sp. GCM10030250]|uniref:hypothetical protein n=1 Tax=Actinoplanes sp. GCM10030250 TaxID=3273376 RepID=UPI003621C770
MRPSPARGHWLRDRRLDHFLTILVHGLGFRHCLDTLEGLVGRVGVFYLHGGIGHRRLDRLGEEFLHRHDRRGLDRESAESADEHRVRR